jgi:hypothetical protein
VRRALFPPRFRAVLEVGVEGCLPILSFHDNYGKTYYCDGDGVHGGRWAHPHEDELRKNVKALGFARGLLTERKRLRWRGWNESHVLGLGEPPELARPEDE